MMPNWVGILGWALIVVGALVAVPAATVLAGTAGTLLAVIGGALVGHQLPGRPA